MAAADCLFCRIVERKLPSEVVFETEEVLGFRDVHPQAPVHVLFVPKRHLAGVDAVDETTQQMVGWLVLAANEIARKQNIRDRGYRLVINCNADGGQTVSHLHLHLLGGRRMTWPPG